MGSRTRLLPGVVHDLVSRVNISFIKCNGYRQAKLTTARRRRTRSSGSRCRRWSWPGPGFARYRRVGVAGADRAAREDFVATRPARRRIQPGHVQCRVVVARSASGRASTSPPRVKKSATVTIGLVSRCSCQVFIAARETPGGALAPRNAARSVDWTKHSSYGPREL
jgi:hypothetical protein